jgi:hypothetical protein
VIWEPSIPTDTMGLSIVSGVPPAPRIAARVGHVRSVDTLSPGPSDGRIDLGDHATHQAPEASDSSNFGVHGQGADGSENEVAGHTSCRAAARNRDSVEVAPRRGQTPIGGHCRLNATKSRGGRATNRSIALKSRCDQATRYCSAVVSGWPVVAVPQAVS